MEDKNEKKREKKTGIDFAMGRKLMGITQIRKHRRRDI